MKSKKKFILASTAILLVLYNFAFAYRPVIDLGTVNGTISVAHSINDLGQIVGQSGYPSGGSTAVLFRTQFGQNNLDLGSLNGDTSNTDVFSINNNSQIVGIARGHACLYDSTGRGANINIDTRGTSGGFAYAINNQGKIVGISDFSSGVTHACIFDSSGNGASADLGTIGGYTSWASSINDRSQIVGSSYITGNTQIRACLYSSSGGANIDLKGLSPFSSEAESINNNGQIVGYSVTSLYNFPYHACLFDPTGNGANLDLGLLSGFTNSCAYSINDNGQIVGNCISWINSNPVSHATLFDITGHGNNIDLNSLINPNSGWVLTQANCINNNGWIVGKGINPQGYERAFLLTPEPATVLLFAIGGLALRRRK